MKWIRSGAYSGSAGDWSIAGHDEWVVPFPFGLFRRGALIKCYPCKDSAKAAARLLDGAAKEWKL